MEVTPGGQRIQSVSAVLVAATSLRRRYGSAGEGVAATTRKINLPRCGHAAACGDVDRLAQSKSNFAGAWLGGSQGKRYASLHPSRRDVGYSHCLLPESSVRGLSQSPGALQGTARSRLRRYRCDFGWSDPARTVCDCLFSTRPHAPAKPP